MGRVTNPDNVIEQTVKNTTSTVMPTQKTCRSKKPTLSLNVKSGIGCKNMFHSYEMHIMGLIIFIVLLCFMMCFND